MTFVPSEQVIIALEDTTPSMSIYKNFQKQSPDDKFELSNISIGNRDVEVIKSKKLYDILYEYLALKLDEYQVQNLKVLIDEYKKIKLFYVTPKELLNIMPSSNISMSMYNNSYCIMFLTATNEIVILLQAINPIVAIDENLYSIILQFILKGCVRYVFNNKDILNKHLANDDIFTEYYQLTNQWYKELITIIIDKYNMFNPKNVSDSKRKNVIINDLQLKLINIIKDGSYNKVIPKEELIKFFKYILPSSTDILKRKKARSQVSDLIKIKDIGYDNNKEMLAKYLTEIYKPLESILSNNILQAEVLLVNQEYSIIMDAIKSSYSKVIDNIIDVMHFIKYTIFQELYHYHTIAENYYTHKNHEKEILDMLVKGEIFSF